MECLLKNIIIKNIKLKENITFKNLKYSDIILPKTAYKIVV